MNLPELAAEATEVDDALLRVHHHSYKQYRPTIFDGLPAPTLCGIRSKPPTPDAHELPCCPLCGEVLRSQRIPCRVDPEVSL